MKKRIVYAMIVCLAGLSLAGCAKEEAPQQDTTTVQMEGTVEVAEDTHEGEARSLLTGEWVSEEEASMRPLAIMLGNTTGALPQYGIGQAGVVYESPVEGGLTRLMAVIQDYEEIDKIMSVRSCRHYFVHWALEYDAIYAHYGQAKYALDILGKDYVDNLNGLDGAVGNVMYERDSSRKAPHNAYTDGEKIQAGIEVKGYETTLADDQEAHFLFAEDTEEVSLADGVDAAIVRPGYQVNEPWFAYDEADGLYYRFQYGAKQIDAIDNSQISCKNIILQISSVSVIDSDHGYLDVETVGSGTGYYVTCGKAIPITWSKESVTAPTRYYTEDGAELEMNQGKTWICIVDDTYEDKITLGDGES